MVAARLKQQTLLLLVAALPTKWEWLAAGEEIVGCIAWVQTGGCDPNGPEEHNNRLDCGSKVESGASGYCACQDDEGNTVRRAQKHCDDKVVFNCERACHENWASAKQGTEDAGWCRGQQICRCKDGGGGGCICGEPEAGMNGCCNMGCGACDVLCQTWKPDVNEVPEGYEAAPMSAKASRVNCPDHLSCEACVEDGCAWCLSQRACRPDEPWHCQGDVDHVSRSGVGKHHKCPSADDLQKDRRDRLDARARAEQAALLAAPKEEAEERVCNTANGGCEDDAPVLESNSARKDHVEDAKNAAAKAARARLKRRQQEEMERIRNEAAGGGRDSDSEDAKAKDEKLLDLQRRAKLAEKRYGSSHPYETLGVPTTSSSAQIRKAYRRLSLQLHPDKNRGHEDIAQLAFADVVAAWEILSVPDSRAMFDDFGRGAASEGDTHTQGFQTEWEWETYGSKEQGAAVFYRADPFITNLDAARWTKRMGASNSVWIIEFYAPWCSHCQSFVQEWKRTARLAVQNGDPVLEQVEFGAVNCVNEHKVCGEWFGVRAFPSIMAVNERHGTRQEFHGDKTAEKLLEWAKLVAEEWRWLFSASNLLVIRSISEFVQKVLESKAFAVVMFTDGLDCQACKTAKTNLLRVSAGLAGVGNSTTRPVVAVVDCTESALHALCYEGSDTANAECALELSEQADKPASPLHICHGLPRPPHAPVVKGFASGTKLTPGSVLGEALYNSNNLEQHVALELLERGVRLALTMLPSEGGAGLAAGKFSNFKADEKPEEPPQQMPPRPPPMWSGPPPRQAVPWDGRSGLPGGGRAALT